MNTQSIWGTWFSEILPPYGRDLDYTAFQPKLFYDSMKRKKQNGGAEKKWTTTKISVKWSAEKVLLQRQKYQGNGERLSVKSHGVHHKGKKIIFHCCLAVLFLPETGKIRPGVFRIASFTEDYLNLINLCRTTERDTGFFSFSLGPGSKQWSDGTVTTTYWFLPQPTSGMLFLACPWRQGAQK